MSHTRVNRIANSNRCLLVFVLIESRSHMRTRSIVCGIILVLPFTWGITPRRLLKIINDVHFPFNPILINVGVWRLHFVSPNRARSSFFRWRSHTNMKPIIVVDNVLHWGFRMQFYSQGGSDLLLSLFRLRLCLDLWLFLDSRFRLPLINAWIRLAMRLNLRRRLLEWSSFGFQ
jgi:hypothetical protein